MKKICPGLLGIILTFSVYSMEFSNGIHYTTLHKQVPDVPQVLEFFSFYCSPCYQFEQILHISDSVKRQIPKSIKVIKYHVEFFGALGKELTKAWAVAITLGVEDKIALPMFNAVQKNHSVKTTSDILKIFISAGVESADYNAAWNSFLVSSLVAQQEKAATDLNVHSLPSMYVKGKYYLNMRSMETNSVNIFLQQYVDMIKYLIEKN